MFWEVLNWHLFYGCYNLCIISISGMCSGDLRGILPDRFDSYSYRGRLSDCRDGLAKPFWGYDWLWGPTCGSSNPEWGITDYLWRGHQDGFRILFCSQSSAVYSAQVCGVTCIKIMPNLIFLKHFKMNGYYKTCFQNSIMSEYPKIKAWKHKEVYDHAFTFSRSS